MSACCVLGALLFGYVFRTIAALAGRRRNDDEWQRPTRSIDP